MPHDRFKIIPAVYLYLIEDNQILMLQRQNSGYCDGCWSLPAGHVDQGETITEAAVREIKEEIDIDIKIENLELVHVLNYRGTDQERVAFFFRTNSYQGEPKNMEPNKCGGLEFFPLDSLPEKMVPEAKQAIEKIQQKQIYSEIK